MVAFFVSNNSKRLHETGRSGAQLNIWWRKWRRRCRRSDCTCRSCRWACRWRCRAHWSVRCRSASWAGWARRPWPNWRHPSYYRLIHCSLRWRALCPRASAAPGVCLCWALGADRSKATSSRAFCWLLWFLWIKMVWLETAIKVCVGKWLVC